MKRIAIVAALASAAAMIVFAPPAIAGGALLVDDDLAQCPAAQFTSIQTAVTAAAATPGTQKIRVCAGTYPENVSIGPGNSLEIVGDGTAKTFITGVAGTAGPIIGADKAGRVTVEDLTIDAKGALQGAVVFCVQYRETDGVIKNVAVLNARNPDGSSQGIGIRVESTGAPTDVRIEDNLVQNFTRAGISANGLGVTVHVEGNTVVGPVPPKVWAPNGIQISRGAQGVVEGNEVRDATSPNPPGGAGSGILLFCAGPSTVQGNEVLGSDLGIALGDNADGRVIGNEVRDSVFDAYSLQFIGTLFGPLGCPAFPSPTTNNLLEGNKAFGSGENGVSIASFDPTNPAPPSGNRIVETEIRNSGIDGIRVFDGTGNLFAGNSISGSGEHDAHDDTVGTGTAGTANTWEANDCVTSQPPGLCED